jgi:hypothetical protein
MLQTVAVQSVLFYVCYGSAGKIQIFVVWSAI